MSSTQVKPKTSGSFTTITTTATGCTSKSSTGLPTAPGLLHMALLACNSWHNQPGNATTIARAQKIASAAGIQLQEV